MVSTKRFLPEILSLRMAAGRDTSLIVLARILRTFAYGFLSVVLALYLAARGHTPAEVGLVFTVSLAGGAVMAAGMSFAADRWGRRRILLAFALVMAASGGVLARRGELWVLLLVGAAGTISPSGQEVGPFLPLEQAALAGFRAQVDVGIYAWYNVMGSLAVAAGGLMVRYLPPLLRGRGWDELSILRSFVWAFAAAGIILAALYVALTPGAEPSRSGAGGSPSPLRESRRAVFRLAGLFGLDALAGGLVIQSLVAFWFHQRFQVPVERLGLLFFGTNLLSAVSFFAAARLSRQIGLLNTMVFTHLPSNVLLMLVPLMPSWPLAAAALLGRHALSQMDVPTRQAYTMALVRPSERSAAAGVTNAARTAAASVAPSLSGVAYQTVAAGLPFVVAGGLKIVYDVALWITFRRAPIPEGRGGA